VHKFKLVSKFKPAGDQPEAIKQLVENIQGVGSKEWRVGRKKKKKKKKNQKKKNFPPPPAIKEVIFPKIFFAIISSEIEGFLLLISTITSK